jgi:hypothetical protein
VSVYGKLEGITGPVAGKYAGYIEFESIAFGKARPGKPYPGNYAWVELTKSPDCSSVALYRLAMSGEWFKAAFVIYQGSGNMAGPSLYEIGRVYVSKFSCDRRVECLTLTVDVES